MFERFSADARDVLVRARIEARALGHRHVGTEHLLLGVVGSDGGNVLDLRVEEVRAAIVRRNRGCWREPDAAALATIGIDLDAVRAAVETSFGPGALDVTPAPGEDHLPFTTRAKRALEHALRESLRLRHRHIDPAHVLLGILLVPGSMGGDVVDELTPRWLAASQFEPLRAALVAQISRRREAG